MLAHPIQTKPNINIGFKKYSRYLIISYLIKNVDQFHMSGVCRNRMCMNGSLGLIVPMIKPIVTCMRSCIVTRDGIDKLHGMFQSAMYDIAGHMTCQLLSFTL